MGGKQKQSQRTKNNVRPSSSGRSAEILGNAVTSFVGFGGGLETKPLPVLFPTLTDTPDDELNSDFMLVVKKLNKKDPITKCKALQEMTDIVESSTVENVVSVLSYWSRLYPNLTIDTEHKVRELTQVTHGNLVRKCGREVAPYLKQLIPSWLMAQYDNYAPAATNAQNSLQGAFPEAKLPEVIAFCKAEMMMHISNNLIGNTFQSMQNKNIPADTLEMKYDRIVISSLQGFDFFTKHLPPKHLEWLWNEQEPILENAKFWKLSSHKNTQIRAAWFGAIARQFERFKDQFAEKYGAKTIKILIGNLNEQDPVVAMQLWDCLLLLIVHVKDWYTWVDKKADLRKRMLEVTENGGWGNSVHLSNILLPLLAHLPQEMIDREFYSDFFDAMLTGLDRKVILASKSQRQAWITSIAECLRYLSINQIENFALEVVTSVHRRWLEKILINDYEEQTRHNLLKHSGSNMASLVKYWLKLSKDSNHKEKYDQMIRNFWLNLSSTLLQQISKLSTDHQEITKTIEFHTSFLQSLKATVKKRTSIRFEVASDKNTKLPVIEVDNIQDINKERYIHNLNNFVFQICSQYFQFACTKELSAPVFTPLYTLLSDFDSKELFIAIAKDFPVNSGKDVSLLEFYSNILKSWLTGDTMRCKAVVDVVFLVITHLSVQEQKMVFDSFKQFVPAVVEMCISKSISHPYSSIASVREWTRSDLVDTSLSAICYRLVKEGSCQSKNLLLMSFSQDRNGDIMISPKACNKILSILAEALTDVESVYLDVCASVASQIVTNLLAEDEKCDNYDALLLEMFKLNVSVQPNDTNMSEDTWWEIKTSWQDGLSTMEEKDRKSFVKRAVDVLHGHFLKESTIFDLKFLEHIVDLIPSLMTSFNEDTDPKENLSEIISTLQTVFNFESIQNQLNLPYVEMCALKYDVISSKINCPFTKDDTTKKLIEASSSVNLEELSLEMIVTYMKIIIFKALFLKLIISGPKQNAEDIDEETINKIAEKELYWSSSVLEDVSIQNEVASLLRDFALVRTLDVGYSFWQHYDIISQNKNTIESLLKEITNQINSENAITFFKLLTEKAAKEGFYWSFVKETNQKDIVSEKVQNEKLKSNINANIEDSLTGDGFFHNMQAILSDTSDKELIYKTKYRIMLRCFYLANMKDKTIIDDDFAKYCLEDKCDIDLIVNMYYKHNDVMLYEKDVSHEDWCKIVSNTCIVDALTTAIQWRGWDMPSQQWDFTTITLSSLVESLDKSAHAWSSTKVVLLARSILDLFLAVESFISTIKDECLKREPLPHVVELPTEWTDIFLPHLNHHLFNILMQVLESAAESKIGANHVVFIDSLTKVLKKIDWYLLPSGPKLSTMTVEKIEAICLKVLEGNNHHASKYLAYYTLKMLAKSEVLDDAERLSVWSQANGEDTEAGPKPQFSMNRFQDYFTANQEVIDASLSQLKVGEQTCTMMPFTDIYNITLGYLLVYEVVLEICSLAHDDLQHQYIEVFSDGKCMESLICNCLRLMPSDLIEKAQENNTSTPQYILNYFKNTPSFSVTNPPKPEDMSWLSCRMVYLALSGIGARFARGWWGIQSGKLSRTFDRLVTTYVTPTLVHDLLTGTQEKFANKPDTKVTIRMSTYEIVCEYTVEERRMQLTVLLNSNHPLGIPRVITTGAPTNHSHWITMYLSYQYGSLSRTFELWTGSISHKIESSQPCYICYCRLHPQTGVMPKSCCRTCKNKFHSICLFKWFKTSKKTECPICRTNF